MKTIQRNKIKFKVFEKDELKHELKMCEEDIYIILDYQDKFPELMIENGNGFCIDARLLHKRLKLQQDFSDWIKKQIKSLDGKKEFDYSSLKGNCTTMRPNASIEYYLTLEFAKEICMVVGVAPRTNKDTKRLSKIVRKYFIVMEKTLKNYEEWNKIREPEKEQAKIMKKSIQDWCNRNQYDSTLEVFYTREFNMLNESLTGELASGLRVINECKDNVTRNHLDKDTNDALLKLQEFNIQLLNANMSFEERTKLIRNLCRNQYSNLYLNKLN